MHTRTLYFVVRRDFTTGTQVMGMFDEWSEADNFMWSLLPQSIANACHYTADMMFVNNDTEAVVWSEDDPYKLVTEDFEYETMLAFESDIIDKLHR